MKSDSLNSTRLRRQRIVDKTRRHASVSVEALAEEFGVSTQTIRRDLNRLCDANILRRRHGGAELLEGVRNTAYDMRRTIQAEAKQRIGAAVAGLVGDGATVFISIGTTPAFVAHALRIRRNLTVVTNNLNAALALSEVETNRIILPGGELRLPDRDILGEAASAVFSRYRADFGIYGVGGIDSDGALLDFHEAEVAAREAIRMNARRSVLVADCTKFGRLAPIVGGALSDPDLIVVDARPGDGFAGLLDQAGDRLHIVGDMTR